MGSVHGTEMQVWGGLFHFRGTLRATNPLGSGQEGERFLLSASSCCPQPGGGSGGQIRPQCLIRHQLWSGFY